MSGGYTERQKAGYLAWRARRLEREAADPERAARDKVARRAATQGTLARTGERSWVGPW